MSTSYDVNREGSGERPTVAEYLQAVAASLAAADATPEHVMRAAQARDPRPNGDSRDFRVPDPRVRYANVAFTVDNGGVPRPTSVLFVFDENAAPVALGDLVRAFGAWFDATGATLSEPNPVQFKHMYPPEFEATRPDGPLTHIRASLDGRSRTPDVRVRSVLLRRFGGR